jgi:2'-5' RNA ligase
MSMPGRRAQAYYENWQRFVSLPHTQDSPARERQGVRRWLLWPYVAFVIPIDDPAVVAQGAASRDALRPWMAYNPQPDRYLHVTLHYVGLLRPAPWVRLPNAWGRSALDDLAERVRPAIEGVPAFDVHLGPLNAFPGVLFAEVHERVPCLRVLRARLRRALPLRARPPTVWSFLPHVTLGFWGQQPVPPLIKALLPYRTVNPVQLRVDTLHFTVYTRALTARQDFLDVAREEIIAAYKLKDEPD